MATIAQLTAVIDVQDNLSPALNKAESQMQQLRRTTDRQLTSVSAAFQNLSNEVRPILLGVGAALAGALGYSIKKAVDFDSLKRGLTAVAGSAQEAEAQLGRLKEMAKLPGLGFEEAVQGSLRLQSAGLSAQMAEKAIREFGNALALEGKGKAELQGVITALAQIQSKGKVTAEEINQIAERWGGVRKAMKEAFGTADTEAIQKMGITSEQFITKLTAAMEKNERVTSGARAALDNMMDSLNQAAASLGQIFLPTVEAVAAAIGAMAEGFTALPQSVQTAIGAVSALTLGLGLLAGAITWVATKLKALKAVIDAGVFTKLAAGLAAWGVGLSSLAPALAGAAVGWTLMAASAVRAFAASEQARGEAERIAAIYRGEVAKSLDAASGSIERLRAEWEFTIAGFEKGKVPTFIVEGFRKEVEKLGYKLTETGIVAEREFAKMAEAAKSAMDSFSKATLAIGIRAQSGATTRLEALKEQLAATNAAIQKVSDEMVLPKGVSADDFLKAADAKKKAQVELNRLIGNQKALQGQILIIEQQEEKAKKNEAEWARIREEHERRLVEIREQFNSILANDSDTRAFANFGKTTGILEPLEAAQMKLQSIESSIQALFQHGLENGIEQLAKNMVVINKLLKDWEAADIGVKAARRVVDANAQKTATLKWIKENLDGIVEGVYRVIPGIIGFSNSLSAAGESAQRSFTWLDKVARVLNTIAYMKLGVEESLGAVSEAMQEVVSKNITEKMDRLRIQAENWAYAFTDAFLDGLRRIRDEGFGGLLRSFEEMLMDMAMAFLRSQLITLMTNFFGSMFGGMGGGILGDASGGAFTPPVGGSPFGRLELAPAGAGPVVVNMNIATDNSQSFRDSQAQLMADAFRQGYTQQRRNRGRF